MKNPWKDIAPYETSDAVNFKGRDEDIRKFTKILRQNEFSVLYAESGIGKTSFINAGIIPAFVGEDYAFIRVEFPLDVLTPIGDKTDEALKANLEKWLCNKIFPKKGRLLQEFAEATSIEQKLENNLWWKLHAYQYKVGERIKKPFIIFDQFEEVFQKANPGLLRKLFAILDSLSSRIPPRVVLDKLSELEEKGIYVSLNRSAEFKVLFSLRKEYLAEFDYWTNDIYSNSQLLQSRMILLPFTKAQAEEVITQQKIGEEQVTTLIDVKDDILNLFEQRMSDFTTNSCKHSYEAFLLSIVCSRLYAIAIDSRKKKLTKDDLVNINLKELILKFYNESIGDFIPKRHLKIIEEELVDNSGERNRIKLTTDNLVAIKFQERYLPELKNKHIVKSSDGYVELIHDRVAEAVFYKRKEYNRKQWFLLQRIVISCFILFFTGMALWLGWSDASFETGYLSREITKKELKIPTTNERCVNEPSVEFLVVDNDLHSEGIIVNCPNLKDIEIHGREPISGTLYIVDCPRLVSLSISDSITDLSGRIAECPNLHQIRLPQNVDYISSFFFENIDSLEIDVPETAKDKFIYENKILWDLKRERIIYAQVDADTLLLFPKELEHCDSLSYLSYDKYSRKFRNAKNERPKIDVKGNTIVKVNPFKAKVVDLSDAKLYGKIDKIGKKAFYNCHNVQEIKLPRSLKYIDDEAFAGCSSLDSIDSLDSLSSLRIIGSEAFAGCTNLTEIKLPESLDSLGRYTFSGCSRLKKVQLPDKLNLHKENDIIYTQFDGCDSLDNISFSEKSVFSEKDGIIFNKEEPCFFIGKNINYSDSTIKVKNDVLIYSYEYTNKDGKTISLSHSIHAMNKKHHVAFQHANGSRTRENLVVYNPDSVEYLPLFRGNVVFIGSHKLRELHIANVSPRNTKFYIPEALKSGITLYVPYGCKKYFTEREFSLFKEIKEDPWALRFQNMLYEMLDSTLSQSKVTYIFCIAIVLVVYFLVYIIYKKRYFKKHSKENTSRALWIAFSTLFVFLLTWMSIYWTLFFAFESTYAMIIGHFVGIVVALCSTWVLVYARNGDVWMNIKKGVRLLVVICKSLTLEDMKRYLTVLLERIYLMLAQRIKNNVKVILAILLISTLTGFFLHKRNSWSEAIDKAELMMSKKDIIEAESLLYSSMPRWTFLLSEQQQNDLKDLYERISKNKNIPNTKVVKEFSRKGHSENVNVAAFSHNEKYAVTASSDGIVIVWNLLTGDTIRTFKGDDVKSIAISPNDSLVASSSYRSTFIWDVLTGDTLCTLKDGYSGSKPIAFSHNGRMVATRGSVDGTAIVWNLLTGDTIRTFNEHRRSITSIAFSHDDSLVATKSSYGRTTIWNVLTGDSLCTLRDDSRYSYITPVAFSHNDDLIATSNYGDVTICNVLTGDSICTLSDDSRYSSVRSLVFSPNDSLVATGSSKGIVTVWNVLTKDTICTWQSHENDEINKLIFDSAGNQLFVGMEKNLAVFDFLSKSEKYIKTVDEFTYGSSKKIIPSFNSQYVCIYGGEHIAILRDTLQHLKGYSHNENIRSVAFSGNDRIVASFNDRVDPIIWDVETGDTICSLKWSHFYPAINSVAFSNDGKTVAGSSGNIAIVWNALTGDTIRTIRKHQKNIDAVALSYNGKYVLSASSGAVVIYDTSTGDTIQSWPISEKIEYASFISKEQNVILGTKDGKIFCLSNIGKDKNAVKEYKLDSCIRQFDSDYLCVIDGRNYIYDAKTGKELYDIRSKLGGPIYFASAKKEFYVISNNRMQKLKLLSLAELMENCHKILSGK